MSTVNTLIYFGSIAFFVIGYIILKCFEQNEYEKEKQKFENLLKELENNIDSISNDLEKLKEK